MDYKISSVKYAPIQVGEKNIENFFGLLHHNYHFTGEVDHEEFALQTIALNDCEVYSLINNEGEEESVEIIGPKGKISETKSILERNLSNKWFLKEVPFE